MTKTKLDWALAARAKGLPVFALTWTDAEGNCSCGDVACTKQGKHPIPGSQGWKDFVREEDQVRAIWTEWPEANIGVYPDIDWVIIDLDLKQGKDGLTAFCNATGLEPYEVTDQGFVVQTTTGGYHLYYKTATPFACSVGLLEGVDVRAVGGYVLYAGSTIGSLAYEIYSDGQPLAIESFPMVQEILRKPRERETKTQEPTIPLDSLANIDKATEYLKTTKKVAKLGRGNRTVYEVAGFVKDLGVSEDECARLMWDHYNPRCEPPWSHEERKTFLDPIESMYKRGQNAPGSKTSMLIDMLMEAGGFEDISGMVFEEEVTSEYASRDPDNPFGLFTDMQAARKTYGQAKQFIYCFLPGRGLHAVLGKRSVGKTVVMMDVAHCIACDIDWQGWPTTKGLKVVYACGEDQPGALDHLEAWRLQHGRIPDKGRFIFAGEVVNLLDAESCKSFTLALKQYIPDNAEAAVFLDTWQRSTSGTSQNEEDQMQIAVHNAEGIARSFNGVIVCAFHPPKGSEETITGSAIIENSTTGIWRIEGLTGTKRKITNVRIKGKGTDYWRDVVFVERNIGTYNDHGQEETGVFLIPDGGRNFGITDSKQCELDSVAANGKRGALAEIIRSVMSSAALGSTDVGKKALGDALAASAKAARQDKTTENAQRWEAFKEYLIDGEKARAALDDLFVRRAGEDYDYGARDGLHLVLKTKDQGNKRASFSLVPHSLAMAVAQDRTDATAGLGESIETPQSKTLDTELADM